MQKINLPPNRWACTAAKAAAVAIPRNLENAAKVMQLSLKKDTDNGGRLIKKYMKPTPKWKKWNEGGRVGPEPKKWYDDEIELWQIYEYCKRDVEVEFELDEALPDLSEYERNVWLLNQEMNLRGVQVDLHAVKKIHAMIRAENKRLQKQVKKITKGKLDSTAKLAKVLKWLKKEGVKLPNMQAKTIEEAVKSGKIKGDALKVLRIRQFTSRTSNKKYDAFLTRAGNDGRIRDLSLYHGASTGRESGTGVQPHNFPKGKIKNTDEVISIIKEDFADRQFLRLAYGNIYELFSSSLRGMFTASANYKIIAADFNAIECRVLNWFAGNKTVLDDFEKGRDPYVRTASKIFGFDVSNLDPESDRFKICRFVGKTAELGLGYQMGDKKFLKTCIDWGSKAVDAKLAKKAVKAYRESHQPVTQLWSNIERAAVKAVREPGKRISVNKTTWFFENKFLWCQLPSGRKLAYFGPTIKMEKTPWGDMMPKLHHWGVDPVSKKWVNRPTYGGKLTENICQATARDIMVNGALKARAKGYYYLFNVHDEIICEHQNPDMKEFQKILTTLPKWANGLPVKAGAWVGPRYKKE